MMESATIKGLATLLKAGTPSLFNRAATSAPALCVLTLLSM